MVVIQTSKGKIYQFANSQTAAIWMKNFPELYDGDLSTLFVYTDKKYKDSIEFTIEPIGVEEIIECQGCHNNLKFTIEPKDVAFTIKCPACHTSHLYHV